MFSYNGRNVSFDGDAMVSCEVDGVQRDMFMVTPNTRMKKKQFVGAGVADYDIYTDRQHGLRVPFKKTCSKLSIR